MALECQAALEQAVLNKIIAANIGYTAANCKRMYDGEPPPLAPPVFVSVWHDGSRSNQAKKTSLDEELGVYVTTTILCAQPFDRLIAHRDDMEKRNNAIRALIHTDAMNNNVSNAANVLAGFDQMATPVGFREALCFLRFDPIQIVGGNWFKADPAKAMVGVTQRIVFGNSRRVQAVLTAS